MSDPTNWYEWIKLSAFVAGIILGGFAIGSPAWVWLKKQLLTAMACWLATIGMVLISMSIWQSVEIEGPGMKLRIAELSDIVARQSAVIRANAALTLAAAERPRLAYAALETIDTSPAAHPESEALKDYLEKFAGLKSTFLKFEDYAEGSRWWGTVPGFGGRVLSPGELAPPAVVRPRSAPGEVQPSSTPGED
jgi:hypothetical protein